MKVVNNWLEGVSRVPTKKQGGEITPRGIVMHFTCGWTTEGDIETLARSTDRQVSAHLVVGRDGAVTQIVPFNRKAWHAGPSQWPMVSPKYIGLNNYAIGIEVSNIGWLKDLGNGLYGDFHGNIIDGKTGAFKNSKAKRKTSSPPASWPHLRHPVVGTAMLAWEPYTAEQLQAIEEICLALRAEYPTIVQVWEHEEIDTRHWKSDPGPVFPTARYEALFTGDVPVTTVKYAYVPAPLPPVPAPLPAYPAAMRKDNTSWRDWTFFFRK